MADAEIIREVSRCVEEAIRKNRRIEQTLIALLIVVAWTGLVLLVLGAITQNLGVLLPGSLCELSVAMPIRSLVKLRQENIRLAILPQLIRMADTQSEKKLVFKFIETLIRQIGS